MAQHIDWELTRRVDLFFDAATNLHERIGPTASFLKVMESLFGPNTGTDNTVRAYVKRWSGKHVDFVEALSTTEYPLTHIKAYAAKHDITLPADNNHNQWLYQTPWTA